MPPIGYPWRRLVREKWLHHTNCTLNPAPSSLRFFPFHLPFRSILRCPLLSMMIPRSIGRWKKRLETREAENGVVCFRFSSFALFAMKGGYLTGGCCKKKMQTKIGNNLKAFCFSFFLCNRTIFPRLLHAWTCNLLVVIMICWRCNRIAKGILLCQMLICNLCGKEEENLTNSVQ